MPEYKLSFTAEEIEVKLKKVQDGGLGYTEGETQHPIDPKYMPSGVVPKEINLADYGIDLAAIAMSGQKTTNVSGTRKLWEEINISNNFVLLSNFQVGNLRINPTMTTHSGNITTSVAFQVQAVIGDMMTISVVMGSTWDSVNGYGDETYIVCVATTVTLT